MLNVSGRKLLGVPDTYVIKTGGLKGIVSVTPSWGGMTAELYEEFCREAYSEEELKQVEHEAAIICGKEHAKEPSSDLVGYEVPNSAFFIDTNTPTITFSKKNMRMNKKLYDRFQGYDHIEFLYHPLLQALIIRTCEANNSGAVSLISEEGNPVSVIAAEPFCEVIYEQMDWIEEYSFKFKGIMRKGDNGVVMLFYLDEPQILVGKGGVKGAASDNYIPYRKSELKEENPNPNNILRFGVSYAMRKRRDKIIRDLSNRDLIERGIIRENPLIGKIPSREEIKTELNELLMSM